MIYLSWTVRPSARVRARLGPAGARASPSRLRRLSRPVLASLRSGGFRRLWPLLIRRRTRHLPYTLVASRYTGPAPFSLPIRCRAAFAAPLGRDSVGAPPSPRFFDAFGPFKSHGPRNGDPPHCSQLPPHTRLKVRHAAIAALRSASLRLA